VGLPCGDNALSQTRAQEPSMRFPLPQYLHIQSHESSGCSHNGFSPPSIFSGVCTINRYCFYEKEDPEYFKGISLRTPCLKRMKMTRPCLGLFTRGYWDTQEGDRPHYKGTWSP
jgi:hypothetical protein